MHTQSVPCRYCGFEMQTTVPTLIHAYANGIMPEKQYTAYYKCGICGSTAPLGYGRTKDEALENAHQEAMRTPTRQTYNTREEIL